MLCVIHEVKATNIVFNGVISTPIQQLNDNMEEWGEQEHVRINLDAIHIEVGQMVEDARTSQTLDTKLKKAITLYWKMKNLLGKAGWNWTIRHT